LNGKKNGSGIIKLLNGIWEVGKRVSLGKEKKMEMDFNIFQINTSIKGSF
jgi:hypothetical protein